ncbi:MAG: hypothetical protein PHW69_03850 [Elusimicrobiaceae bacterium]|nr:hypothetical protein [Elusimicrobiaceae bacterium]
MPADWKWKTIIEPHKVKMVGPLGFTTGAERGQMPAATHHNLFNIPAAGK